MRKPEAAQTRTTMLNCTSVNVASVKSNASKAGRAATGRAEMELDDLSYLLSNPPAPPSAGDGLDLPFVPGSFARECVIGWIREADQI